MILRLSLVSAFLLAGSLSPSPGVRRTDIDAPNISLPPISTFRDFCARCHGYEGAAYGKGFGSLEDDSLRSMIEDMMFGPASLAPDSIDVAAMTAYNVSLKNAIPFAAVFNAGSFLQGKDSILRIEISPGGTVAVRDSLIAVRGAGTQWELKYNPGKITQVVMAITREGRLSELRFPAELWVH